MSGKVQHPLLGSVDPAEGPDVLEECEVPVPASPQDSKIGQIYLDDDNPLDDEAVFTPEPDKPPEPKPRKRELARRLLIRGLNALTDKLSKGE